MRKRKNSRLRKTMGGTLLLGVIFSFAALTVISLVCSAILMTSNNPTGNLKIASLASLLICGAVSGFFTSKYKGEGGVITSIITSVAFIALMLIISMIASKGDVGGITFMNYLCYLMIAVFAAFLGRKRERKRKR